MSLSRPIRLQRVCNEASVRVPSCSWLAMGNARANIILFRYTEEDSPVFEKSLQETVEPANHANRRERKGVSSPSQATGASPGCWSLCRRVKRTRYAGSGDPAYRIVV